MKAEWIKHKVSENGQSHPERRYFLIYILCLQIEGLVISQFTVFLQWKFCDFGILVSFLPKFWWFWPENSKIWPDKTLNCKINEFIKYSFLKIALIVIVTHILNHVYQLRNFSIYCSLPVSYHIPRISKPVGFNQILLDFAKSYTFWDHNKLTLHKKWVTFPF